MTSNIDENRPSTSTDEPPLVPLGIKESGRACWVCFATEEEDREAIWVKPCKCRGTTKWVHQACLQRWVDEKQKSGNMNKVSCPQCQTEYIIVFPNMGLLVFLLDSVDSIIYKGCPFMAAGIVVGAVYWCAVTYGAVTLMQVIGQKEGLALMEQADPLLLLIGLPAIPLALLFTKMIRWEDALLSFLRKHVSKIPIIRSISPFSINISTTNFQDTNLPQVSSPISATRILCGALFMPTIATFFGRIFFESVKSNFHRAVLGGVAFVAIKGCLKIYHKQQNYIRQCRRKILDYNESNVSLHSKPAETSTERRNNPQNDE